MRIRNRKVPLPLSLLSPVPLSDPHLFSRSPVMLMQDNTDSPELPSSSDHLTTPTSCSGFDLRRGLEITNVVAGGLGDTRFEDVVVEGIQTNNDDFSNASITPTTSAAAATTASEDSNGRFLSLSNNEDRVGRWCDGDKAIPLKKRRGIGFNSFITDEKYKDDTNTTTTTTTRKVIMKWNNNITNEDETTEEKQVVKGNDDIVAPTPTPTPASAKKGNAKRGNTILEGSRCSRVNGRGWRCCQPTLVGYSLCEHHLGKGRLRSMTSSTSVKSRSSKKKSKFALGREEEMNDTVDNHSQKKLERMTSFGNKRVKLGVVKARSLSSLLGQTNTMNNNIVAADHASLQQHENISNLDYH